MTRKIFLTCALVVSLFVHIPSAAAGIVFGDVFTAPGNPQKELTRGEAVSIVVDRFSLKKKFGSFIRDCLGHPDECFFVFSGMSDYDGIQFSPLILYPDVFPAHPYYGAINTATILGLVHGFLGEQNSPFHSEINMTKIQALKVILGAPDLMKWKDKFEMTDADYPKNLPFTDPEINSADAWWYSRYLGFALEKAIIDSGTTFGPDLAVTEAEFYDMVTRTLAVSTPDVVITPGTAVDAPTPADGADMPGISGAPSDATAPSIDGAQPDSTTPDVDLTTDGSQVSNENVGP